MISKVDSQARWMLPAVAVILIASVLILPAPVSAATAACPTSIPDAGFTDLAGYSATAREAVNCIAFYDLAAGIGGGQFGPALQVTRAQMAIFLAAVLETRGVTLDFSEFGFTDLAGLSTSARSAIHAIANAGITAGIGGGRYGPNLTVPRWQMAIFLAATLEELGITLDTSEFGFGDLAGLSTTARRSVNAIANAGISVGTGGGLFVPVLPVTRVQMALFLAATLDEGGVEPVIVPAPTVYGDLITDFSKAGKWFEYADRSAGKLVVVDTEATDNFSFDGLTATQVAFFDEISTGDAVSVSGTRYSLTNKEPSDYTSGPVDNVGAGGVFDWVEPLSGLVLNHFDPVSPAAGFTIFMADGKQTSLGAFGDDLQAGDQVSISGGDGSAVTKLRTAHLVNVVVGGRLTGFIPGVSISIDGYSDVFPIADGDTLTVDGDKADTAVEFTAEATVDDRVTYGMKNGLVTATMTNAAHPVQTGFALANLAPGSDFDFDDGGTLVEVDLTAIDRFFVDGIVVVLTEFQDDLTPGDTIEYQEEDGVVKKATELKLKNVAGLSRRVVTDIDTATLDITVEFTKGGPPSEDIEYDSLTPVGLAGTGVFKYYVEGVQVSRADWEVDLAAYLAAPSITPTVSVSVSGGDIIWSAYDR